MCDFTHVQALVKVQKETCNRINGVWDDWIKEDELMNILFSSLDIFLDPSLIELFTHIN